MDCPGFQVLRYGIYDSRVAAFKKPVSPQRRVTRFELELITEDLTGISHIDGNAYPLKKGLFICGKPEQLRYSQLPMRCHYIHLQTQDPALIRLLRQLPDACMLSEPSAVERVFRELVALPVTEEGAGHLLVQSLVASLLAQVHKLTVAELRNGDNISHRAQLIETERFIRGHLAQPLTLEALARRAGFSVSHFHRIFTAWFGKTPHEFILCCRIEAAKASLQLDRCSLIELAASCGFSSQSHFTSQFKKATGQTPLQYRRRMLSRIEP